MSGTIPYEGGGGTDSTGTGEGSGGSSSGGGYSTTTDGSEHDYSISIDSFGHDYIVTLNTPEGSDLALSPPTLGDDPRADDWESLYTGTASDFDGSWAHLDQIENPYNQQYIVGYEVVYEYVEVKWQKEKIPIYVPIYAEDTKSRDAFDAALNKAKEQRDKSYREAFKDYDTVKAEEEAKKKTTNWDLTFRYEDWALPMPQFMPYKAIPTVDVTRMHIEGSMYDWMAGGALYDAQLAGGSLFQGVGDLNSTVFLGLENKNNPSIIDRDRNNLAEVHKILNVTAGEDSSPEASSAFLMHMKRIAESVAYNVAAQEFNTGQINQTTTSFKEEHGWSLDALMWEINNSGLVIALKDGMNAATEAINDFVNWLFGK